MAHMEPKCAKIQMPKKHIRSEATLLTGLGLGNSAAGAMVGSGTSLYVYPNAPQAVLPVLPWLAVGGGCGVIVLRLMA